jgi:hypothetical protein
LIAYQLLAVIIFTRVFPEGLLGLDRVKLAAASIYSVSGDYMREYLRPIAILFVVGCSFSLPSFAQASGATNTQGASAETQQPGAHMDSYIEELRADIRADKTKLISEGLQLDSAQSEKFWPIYRQYQTDLSKINDQRLQLIKQYNDAYPVIDQKTAQDSGQRWLELEGKKVDLQKKYFQEVSKAVSPQVAAQFIQLEHRLDLLIDLQVASALPLIPSQSASKQH